MSNPYHKGVKGHVTDVLVSTTHGRARFPDLLQHSMGEKSIIGFDRYGRVVGAMVPIEAVRILAGFEEHVDDDIRERVRRAALSMLKEAPSEVNLLGLEQPLRATPISAPPTTAPEKPAGAGGLKRVRLVTKRATEKPAAPKRKT